MKRYNLKHILLAVLILVLLLVFLLKSRLARGFVFIIGFISLNLLMTSYKRVIYLPIEFEILSFGIILCSYSFGVSIGIIVAVLGGLVYTIFSTRFSPFTIPMLLGYILMAIIAGFFNNINIVLIGIIANILHNLFVFLIYHFVLRYDPFKNLIFGLSNIFFNFILFLNFSSFFVRLMN